MKIKLRRRNSLGILHNLAEGTYELEVQNIVPKSPCRYYVRGLSQKFVDYCCNFFIFQKIDTFFYTKDSLNTLESKTINIILVHGLMLPRGVSIVTEELHTGAWENLVLYKKRGLY